MARILVVDDENNIRMMVRLALEQAGHEVRTAADGPTGLAEFGDGSDFDLVLLDQRMPGMEGLEVLREMKARRPEARIVMITAYGTIDLAVDAMKAGATDFLRKPFTTDILRGAILGALMTTPNPPALEEVAEPGALVEPSPLLYGLTTVNGYHITSDPAAVVVSGEGRRYTFTVRHPAGQENPCTVLVSAGTIAEIKSLAHHDFMPSENRFWHALSEHVLSNHLYQHADYPPEFALRVDELDRGLRNWVRMAMGA